MSARRLLEIADQVRAIAGSGLHYTEGEFDRERYERLQVLAAELAALSGAGEFEPLLALYRGGDRGYVTPKLDTRLAVFREQSVLLVRERSDGRWALPGGFVDIGDTPSTAAIREMQEEACVTARVTALAGVFDNRLNPAVAPHIFQVFKLVFTGELRDPNEEPAAGDEVSEAAFHPLDALPELSSGRTLASHIECAHQTYTGLRQQAHFD